MALVLVTVGTDGVTNWVKLPDGQKFNLGAMSVLAFVTKLAKGPSSARKALDGWMSLGEASLAVDADKMWDLMQPHRAVWASDSLYGSDFMTGQKSETQSMSAAFAELTKLGSEFQQSTETSSPKKLASDVYLANLDKATSILDMAQETVVSINAKVAAGRKFNAARALADVHDITTRAGSICARTQLVEPWVASDLQVLSSEMARLHDLFHPQT